MQNLQKLFMHKTVCSEKRLQFQLTDKYRLSVNWINEL